MWHKNLAFGMEGKLPMTFKLIRALRGVSCAAVFTVIGAGGTVISAAPAQAASMEDQQELVDRATLALGEVLNPDDGGQARSVLPNARAVMICPRVFRAGFFFGGEGGGCVLLARGGQGTWSAPAFYGMGGGSFGFQAGIQDAEIVMMIMTQPGLRAVMDSQFRLGANASVALVTIGGGVEGATAMALNADIVAFARTRGLFAGISLQGSVMSSDSEGDQVYYGQPVGPIDIVMAMRANNPGADPLRQALMRYSAPPTRAYAAAPVYAAPPAYPPNGYAPQSDVPQQGYAAGGPAPVQAQSLPPPR
jgi:lipid-binding SYLF domain-containing protein